MQVFFWHWPVVKLLMKFELHEKIYALNQGKIAWILVGVFVAFILSFKIFGFPVNNISNINLDKNKERKKEKKMFLLK